MGSAALVPNELQLGITHESLAAGRETGPQIVLHDLAVGVTRQRFALNLDFHGHLEGRDLAQRGGGT